ncbi:hypothetical protein BT69DRAFT_1328149 [Atractiella rhizophila]|nr:hypothetical protein BT69DRAFT_1328149 [Atractiella rhizophila]
MASDLLPPSGTLLATRTSTHSAIRREEGDIRAKLVSDFVRIVQESVENDFEFPPAGSVVKGKEALSLQTTSANFTRFIQRSGPLFALQDTILQILTWEQPSRAIFVSVLWSLICYKPKLLFALPTTLLLALFLSLPSKTSQASSASKPTSTPTTTTSASTLAPPTTTQEPSSSASSQNSTPPSSPMPAPPALNPISPTTPTPHPLAPPTEGSIDYLANLQNIQNLLGLYCAAFDLIVPNLASRPPEPIIALVFIITVALYLTVDIFPWRLAFWIVGELGLCAYHPVVLKVWERRNEVGEKGERKWAEEKVARLWKDWTEDA